MPLPKTVTWVAVADGGKALLLENAGTDAKPDLRFLSKAGFDNPPTRAQGTDRPGRRPDVGPGQRSAMETTDWHRFAEEDFAREVAALLDRAAREDRFDRLVLIAPDRALGRLRTALAPATSARVVATLAKDLTGHPLDAIEAHLAKALFPAS